MGEALKYQALAKPLSDGWQRPYEINWLAVRGREIMPLCSAAARDSRQSMYGGPRRVASCRWYEISINLFKRASHHLRPRRSGDTTPASSYNIDYQAVVTWRTDGDVHGNQCA